MDRQCNLLKKSTFFNNSIGAYGIGCKPFLQIGVPFSSRLEHLHETLLNSLSLNHYLESHLNKNRSLYFSLSNSFSISYVHSRDIWLARMTIFGDLFKQAIRGYFYIKIYIPNNKKGYREALEVALIHD